MSFRNVGALLIGSVVGAALFLACGDNAEEAGPPPVMKLIPGGTFTMGTNDTAGWPYTSPGVYPAYPAHSVTVDSFYLDSTEVTQEDYWNLMKRNPWGTDGALLPAGNLTWFDAALYCNARSRKFHFDTVYRFSGAIINGMNCDSLESLTVDLTKNGYRLPTEAEWEYACRAYSTSDYFWGDYPMTTGTDTVFADMNTVWDHNAGGALQNIATKNSNPFGLFDMSGNAQEWCNDWMDEDYYSSSPSVNPAGPDSCMLYGANLWSHVLRGGAYISGPVDITSVARGSNGSNYKNPWQGFRCARNN